MFDSMFHLPLSILEKLARPVIVYLVLVVLLRLFGKRELAQLNPFDLVVLLSLSNTVQNAIIGDDNSVTGGVIGAFGLLAINWLVVRVLFRSPRLTRALEGRSTVLVRDGQLDSKAMSQEALSREELLSVVHKQGFEGFHRCAGASLSRTAPSTSRPSSHPRRISATRRCWPAWTPFPPNSLHCGPGPLSIPNDGSFHTNLI